MFKAIKDVSCCTDRCIQALEALCFLGNEMHLCIKGPQSASAIFADIKIIDIAL